MNLLAPLNEFAGYTIFEKLALVLSIILTISLTLRLLFGSASRIPQYRAYRVTYLGSPGVGKTTAIITLLDYLVASRLSGRIRVRGAETINALEFGARALDKGLFPLPTSENSSNIYRFDYRADFSLMTGLLRLFLPISRNFRVEIADFAGEYTEQLSKLDEQFQPAVPDTFGDSAGQNFLKWVSEFDKCVMFIDLEKFAKFQDEYISDITASYISFWQKYLDLHADELRPKSGTPVILVFSKADVFGVVGSKEFNDGVSMARMASRKLMEYMEQNSQHVDVVVLSALAKVGARVRLGAPELADAILPSIYGEIRSILT